MVGSVWTDDVNRQLEATTQFRKLLSIERSPPIQEVIQLGVVPRFVEFLMNENFPQLQTDSLKQLECYNYNKDEISQIPFHSKSPFLAAADDTGDVKTTLTLKDLSFVGYTFKNFDAVKALRYSSDHMSTKSPSLPSVDSILGCCLDFII